MGDERKRKRQPQLDMTVAAIQGRYGPWAVTRGAPGRATGAAAPIPHIPTGFEALDRALGTGGLPKGSVCEIVGPATSGKTTLALKVLAEAQRGGGETGGSETRPYRVGGAQKGWGETGGSETRPYEGSGAQKGWREKGGSETRPYEGSEVQRGGNQVGYIDQALYFDADYAYRCGVDLSRLVAGTPQDLAEALAMTEALVRSGSLAALVLDTLDFLWDDASTAQLLAATLSRLRAPLVHSGMILLVLHDSPDARSPALSALAHTASVRLQVVREQWIRQYGDVRGYTARVEVLKNRQGPAGQTVQLKILFNGTVHGDGI